MRRIALFVGLLILLATGSTTAQTPSVSQEPEWSPSEVTVPEIVVQARSPRLWKLVKGQATIWVLGFIEPMPKDLPWNTAPLTHIIEGSDRVLLGPATTVGLFQAIGAVSRSHLPGGQTLDETLSPDLTSKYRATLNRLSREPAKYQHEKPAWAALMLQIDYTHSPAFSTSEPIDTVRRIAREKHVPVTQVANYGGGGVLDQIVSLSDDDGRAALASAITGVDFGLDHAQTAAKAWAIGDLTAVRLNLSPNATPQSLLQRTSAYRTLTARSVDDTVAALRAAMARPGTTVAVLTLPSLVRRGGALDRLRAEGVSITDPPL